MKLLFVFVVLCLIYNLLLNSSLTTFVLNKLLNLKVCDGAIKLSTRPVLIDNTWQLEKLEDNMMYIYSAFYDGREFLHGKNVLRALVISTPITSNVYCQIWKEDSSDPIMTVAKVLKSGDGVLEGGRLYDSLVLTCTLQPKSLKPKYLSLVWTNPCNPSQNKIKIQYPMNYGEKPKHEFGICVPVTFGDIDLHRIIEWVEMHRFLGVSAINVYHSAVSHKTMAVLKYYEREGIIKLFHLPGVTLNDQNGVKIESPIGLNDCMLRNMHSYKWVLVVDLDEIILPRNESKIINYNQLMLTAKSVLKTVKNIYPISYAFRNSYFWVGCEEPILGQPQSYIFLYFQRTNVNNFLFASKSFTNPTLCVWMLNHYCQVPYAMSKWNKNSLGPANWTFDVPQELGLLHHYREIGEETKQEKCQLLKGGRIILDTTAMKYEKYVSGQIKKAVKLLF